MNRVVLKENAKEQIRGKIGILFLITLIIGGISAAASCVLGFIPGGSFIASFIITPAFTLSTIRVYLLVVRGMTPMAKDSFSGFDDFFSAFKVTFLVGLYTFLWSLLFIIPGIIKSYAYSMSLYILADNKGKGARECIRESVEMTDGHKGELFVLDLSFIGWIFLGALTFGIAYIWIIPYYNATRANAYEAIKPVVAVPFEFANNTEEIIIEDTPAEIPAEIPAETPAETLNDAE